MTKTIEIKDWANKHNTFIYDQNMKPLGTIHQEAPMEWIAYDKDGTFIDRYTTKREAKKAITA